MTTIRRAVVADAAALAEFAARAFRETFGRDNTPENTSLYLSSKYGPEIQAREIRDPDMTTLLAEREGRMAGYSQLREAAPPDCVEGPGPLELWRFYVDQAWQGQGVAQALMAATLEAARERGAATMWLCVWEHNARAQAFYRKLGFTDRGATDFMLGNDRQTDRVMDRPL